MQTVQNRTLHATKALIKIVARALIEPVVGTFPQAVQKRTKPPKNAQVKNGVRAHIEPDVG
ncbi:hypothetical protein HMPREF9069_00873 [Atopobium sp. oral taxon 810 str. F0209]|nr:hypothetical protein HMPREF9069_00873 [Atopobium sp. oral taxon 810 str. F0209]